LSLRVRAGQDLRVTGAPFGLGVVFLNVLLEQLGLPVPALPALVVAGALAADGRLPLAKLCALVLAACVIGDGSWYLAGRLYGGRVMRLLCRISLTPDFCVSQTQATFERWGAKALIVAKFVPGLSMIAPPLAGATHMSYPRFAILSALGSSLWIGAALLAGVLLRSEIAGLLPRLAGVGEAAVVTLVVLLAAYIAYKWRERRRFYAAFDMARISVAELYAQLQGGTAPLILDVRSATAQDLDRRQIPGALRVPLAEVQQQLAALSREREVILYCTCPNEASAAQAARVLLNHGFLRVRPLLGGLDAWVAAGYTVEEVPGAPTEVADSTPAGGAAA
jgi:membrane protein DedA with SNARE-associated domain/rhodanese-related sulfurtransferase